MTLEAHDIAVCIDCALLIANGEGTAEHAAAVARLWDGTNLVLGTGEEHFSWTPCDGCGSTLGGDRFDAAYLLEV